MKFLLLAASLVVLSAGQVFAAPSFYWFHTRPKPVILNDDAAKTSKQTHVAYHGTAMYPGTGRLYFQDKVDNSRTTPQSKTVTTFTKGWKTGTIAKPSK